MSINLPDIALVAGNAFQIDTKGVQLEGTAWIEFLNESPFTLPVQIGAMNFQVPAWYDYPVQVQAMQGGIWQPVMGAQFPIKGSAKLLPAPTPQYSTVLLSTLYQTGETPAITTPQPLFRQAFIPNAVTTNPVSSTSLISNGATPVTTDVIDIFGPGSSTYGVIEMKPNGQVDFSVANVDLAGTSNVFASIPNPGTNNNTNIILQLGTTGYITDIFGVLSSQSDFFIVGGKIGRTASGDILDATANAGADLYIKSQGGSIHFQSPNGTTLARIDPTTGNMVIKGTLTQNGTP